MKIEFPTIRIIKGDIEITEEISIEDMEGIQERFTKTGDQPLIKLTLTSKVGKSIMVFQNWEKVNGG